MALIRPWLIVELKHELRKILDWRDQPANRGSTHAEVSSSSFQDDGSNLRIRPAKRGQLLQISKIQTHETPVEATLSDSASRIDVKFASVACESFRRKHHKTVSNGTLGGVIQILNYEIVATTYGPRSKRLTLYIEDFMLLGSESSSLKGMPRAIEDAPDMNRMNAWLAKQRDRQTQMIAEILPKSEETQATIPGSQSALLEEGFMASQSASFATQAFMPRPNLVLNGSDSQTTKFSNQQTGHLSMMAGASNSRLLSMALESQTNGSKHSQLEDPPETVEPLAVNRDGTEGSSLPRLDNRPAGKSRDTSPLHLMNHETILPSMSGLASESCLDQQVPSRNRQSDTIPTRPVSAQEANKSESRHISRPEMQTSKVRHHHKGRIRNCDIRISRAQEELLALPSSWMPAAPGEQEPFANVPIRILNTLNEEADAMAKIRQSSEKAQAVSLVKSSPSLTDPTHIDEPASESESSIPWSSSQSSDIVDPSCLPPDSSPIMTDRPSSRQRLPKIDLCTKPEIATSANYSSVVSKLECTHPAVTDAAFVLRDSLAIFPSSPAESSASDSEGHLSDGPAQEGLSTSADPVSLKTEVDVQIDAHSIEENENVTKARTTYKAVQQKLEPTQEDITDWHPIPYVTQHNLDTEQFDSTTAGSPSVATLPHSPFVQVKQTPHPNQSSSMYSSNQTTQSSESPSKIELSQYDDNSRDPTKTSDKATYVCHELEQKSNDKKIEVMEQPLEKTHKNGVPIDIHSVKAKPDREMSDDDSRPRKRLRMLAGLDDKDVNETRIPSPADMARDIRQKFFSRRHSTFDPIECEVVQKTNGVSSNALLTPAIDDTAQDVQMVSNGAELYDKRINHESQSLLSTGLEWHVETGLTSRPESSNPGTSGILIQPMAATEEYVGAGQQPIFAHALSAIHIRPNPPDESNNTDQASQASESRVVELAIQNLSYNSPDSHDNGMLNPVSRRSADQPSSADFAAIDSTLCGPAKADLFSQFKATYPEYPAERKAFTALCLKIQRLLDTNGYSCPSYWDDFIMRQRITYPRYVSGCIDNADDPLPYEQYYLTKIDDIHYDERLVTEETLKSFLKQNDEVDRRDEPSGDVPVQPIDEVLTTTLNNRISRSASENDTVKINDLSVAGSATRTYHQIMTTNLDHKADEPSQVMESARDSIHKSSPSRPAKQPAIMSSPENRYEHEQPKPISSPPQMSPQKITSSISQEPDLNRRRILRRWNVSAEDILEVGYLFSDMLPNSDRRIVRTHQLRLLAKTALYSSLDAARVMIRQEYHRSTKSRDPSSIKIITDEILTNVLTIARSRTKKKPTLSSAIDDSFPKAEVNGERPWWKDEDNIFNTWARNYMAIRPGSGNSYSLTEPRADQRVD